MFTGLESGKTDVGTYRFEIPVNTLKNSNKYCGVKKLIELRSSWEMAFVKYLDTNTSILEWSSEEIAIIYSHPIKKRDARYWPDFYCKFQTSNGIKEAIIEIKPFEQTQKPVLKETNKSSTNVYALSNYLINQAKWMSAEQACHKKGWKFIKLTEHDIIFNKKIK